VTLTASVAVRRGTFEVTADLTAQAGQILAVLGPNGAGKSTLLRALAGLTPPARGRISLAGRVLDETDTGVHVPPERRRVGMVFQDYLLFDHLTALDNVAYGPRCAGASRKRARADAAGWLDRVGLGPVAEHKPRQLSGGQQQRVALARALASDPQLVLLDEPLAALDVSTRTHLRGELRRHLLDVGLPSVLVTHDPVEAMVLADRLLVLEDGTVSQAGRPAQVAAHPRTEYVAALVGLNLLRGVAADGRVRLTSGGELVARHLPADGPVLVLVSPSAVSVHLAAPPEGSPRNVWPATVHTVEAVGERVRITTVGPPDLLVDVTPQAVAQLRLHQGQRVWLSVKASEVAVELVD
jgi:molybdate transport system ATP-binding protein